MIKLKKNKAPSVPICQMNCDKPLHEKLKKYDMYDTLFNKHSTTLVCGLPGQGKSSLVYSWFKSKECLRKCFDNIFYICPASSMSSMNDNIFSTLPDDKIYNELDADVLDEIIDRIENREEKDDKSCIIIDDMGSQLKKNDVQMRLKKIAMNRRHMNIYQCIILVQTWKSTPPEVRRMATNIILFKVNPNDMASIFEEMLPQYKDKAYAIQKLVYNKPHEYLLINTREGKLFKKFDEILINDD